mmetsp:Transcript_4894/g.17633  ORF Transcript_4894/g.17633 Transcript_4894/m.17633 type:complete len:665 (+) Transcript_4894:501-2495(+)
MQRLADVLALAPDSELDGHLVVPVHPKVDPGQGAPPRRRPAMEQADVTPGVGRHGLRALAGSQSEGLHDGLHCVLQRVPLANPVLVHHLGVRVLSIPRIPEVGDFGRLEVVPGRAVHVLQRVLVLETVLLLVPGARVDLLDHELEGAHHAAKGHGALLVRQQDVRLRHHAVGKPRGRDGEHLLVCLGLREVDIHRDVLQDLLLDGVGHVELQHDVRRKDVLHARHGVLGLLLHQLHRVAGLEERAEVRELWDLLQGLLEVGLEAQVAGEVARSRGPRGTRLGRLDRHELLLGHPGHVEGLSHGGVEVLPQAALQPGERHVLAPQHLWPRRGLLLLSRGIISQQLEVHRRAVPDLIVVVPQGPPEQHPDARGEGGDPHAEVGERGHRRCAHRRVLQDDPVVHVPNVLCRVGGLGALLAQQVQDLGGQVGELAVLDELAKVRERRLLGLGDRPDDPEDGIDDGLLVLKATLLPQHTGQEGHHRPELGGELDAELVHGVHDHNLELVSNLGHERGHLLHQPVDARLVSRLEQRGDGQSGDGPVLVRDQGLHVDVAVTNSHGVVDGDLVQNPDGGKPQHGLAAAEKELQDGDGRRELRLCHPVQLHDRLGGLEDHHLALVPEAGLQKVVKGPLLVGVGLRVRDHARDAPHDHHLRQRGSNVPPRQRGH